MKGLLVIALVASATAKVTKETPQVVITDDGGKQVIGDSPEETSMSMKERKKLIDLSAAKADKAAELAMAEARQEEEEEKAIELSVKDSPLLATHSAAAQEEAAADESHPELADKVRKVLGQDTPVVKKAVHKTSEEDAAAQDAQLDEFLRKTINQKFQHKSAGFKKKAMARLKEKMKIRLAKKAEARRQKEQEEDGSGMEITRMSDAEREDLVKKHHDATQRLKKIAAVKRQELQELTFEEQQTKKKMLALKMKKAQEEDALMKAQAQAKQDAENKAAEDKRATEEAQAALKKQAEEHKAAIVAAKNDAGDDWDKAIEKKAGDVTVKGQKVNIDEFVHKAVLKKYGGRLGPEALARAEVRMKKLVQERLAKKAANKAAKKQVESFDIDAYVKKQIAEKFKHSGMKLAPDAKERIVKKMEARLKKKILEKEAKKHVERAVKADDIDPVAAQEPATAPTQKVNGQDLDAWVAKAVDAKIKASGKKFTPEQEARLRERFSQRLKAKMQAKMSNGASLVKKKSSIQQAAAAMGAKSDDDDDTSSTEEVEAVDDDDSSDIFSDEASSDDTQDEDSQPEEESEDVESLIQMATLEEPVLFSTHDAVHI